MAFTVIVIVPALGEVPETVGVVETSFGVDGSKGSYGSSAYGEMKPSTVSLDVASFREAGYTNGTGATLMPPPPPPPAQPPSVTRHRNAPAARMALRAQTILLFPFICLSLPNPDTKGVCIFIGESILRVISNL
jgi:hypothetical protein